MGLSMQKKLSAYFGLHVEIHLQVFKVNLDQNIEIQLDGTRTTSLGVTIGKWLEMDDPRPVMRKKHKAIFYEDPWMFLRKAADQVGMHHMTICNFLNAERKLYAYELPLH